MDKERRNNIILAAATAALSALFVNTTDLYQDQFAQEVCATALLANGSENQLKNQLKNNLDCEKVIDGMTDRQWVPRWIFGLIGSAVIVSLIKDKMES